ncbi:hypothetical protein HQ865_16340 [Mucilaginibacter mali]|uniref:Uncharacterized protein n=1 Tax=Mucilaginibacter mali TaxID=2740462 RepID=A0A7D4UPW0_9SPHI|nr:hypothetical protein [Mucilaginibacter mali]QKJ31260.1 hypothetical protein HQ865_16340 [Mucilaginibacter mali]
MLSTCDQPGHHSGPVSKIPDKKEIYNYFLNQLKQTAKASGYLKYRLVINRLQQDTVAGNCFTQNSGEVSCYTITIDRTEYLDNYTGTYTTTYTGDVYRLFRNDDGKLDVAGHTAGSQNTVQDHHPNTSHSL